MKIYITLGQTHTHRVNGVTFDKDSIAEIECNDYNHGRQIAFDIFGEKFCFSYEADKINEIAHYFPRGIFKAN